MQSPPRSSGGGGSLFGRLFCFAARAAESWGVVNVRFFCLFPSACFRGFFLLLFYFHLFCLLSTSIFTKLSLYLSRSLHRYICLFILSLYFSLYISLSVVALLCLGCLSLSAFTWSGGPRVRRDPRGPHQHQSLRQPLALRLRHFQLRSNGESKPQ